MFAIIFLTPRVGLVSSLLIGISLYLLLAYGIISFKKF